MNDRTSTHKVRDFLSSYKHAISLDDKKFDRRFKKGEGRADFLLFGTQIVCELKEFREVDIPAHVERVWKKGDIKKEFIETAIARSIHDELRNKAGQVRDTKNALCLHRALGLVILENRRPGDVSAVVLVSAANWQLQRGLDAVDGVLCVDLVNTFKAEAGEPDVMHFAQMILRPTRKGRRLSKLIKRRLMPDLTNHYGMPFRTGYDLATANHSWHVGSDGTFETYKARVTFRESDECAMETTRRVLSWIGKWAWLVGLIVAIIYWIVQRFLQG
jgi:hypothetical protein